MGLSVSPSGRARIPGRPSALSPALLLALVAALLAGRAALPAGVWAQTDDLPWSSADLDSATADSLAKAYADSVARADSLANLGLDQSLLEEGTNISASGILGRQAPPHPINYDTQYGVLRSRQTWDQSLDFYFKLGRAALANRTTVTIIKDPDVGRKAHNRETAFELGVPVAEGLSTGLRVAIARNSDIIGIRLENSIERESDQASLFSRWERSWGRFPYVFDLSLGAVRDRQPEFSRRGLDGRLDFTTSGPLFPGVQLNTGATVTGNRLQSETPEADGTVSESSDRSFDRQGRLGLDWKPNPIVNLAVRGTLRFGQLQRPEQIFDEDTFEERVVTEHVKQEATTGSATMNFQPRWGGKYTATANLSKTDFLYTVDQTRTTITDNFSLDMRGEERILGANWIGTFRSSLTNSDFTRRNDGYIQDQWNRQAELRGTRPVNLRTSVSARGSISLTSRRFKDFQPSGPTSFPPAEQDLFRVSGALLGDYRPAQNFSTSLEGRVDVNRTINLSSTTSINNTDQTGYNVLWTWSYTPFPFWTISQNNSAGANQIYYPFAATRDQLSFIYQLRTSSTMRFTRQVTFELNYNVRYQSRGTFREGFEGERLFGKTGGSDQYDLLLRGLYKPAQWFQFEVSDQYFITRNLTESNNVSRVDSETRRQTLLIRANVNYDFGQRASLTAGLRRSLTHDVSETNTGPNPIPVVRDDDLWQTNLAFRVYFDV